MADQPTRIFSKQQRLKYMREHPDTPTGVILTFRGVPFNLMPFEMGEWMEITQIIDAGSEMLLNVAGIQSAIQGNAIDIESVGVIAGALQYIVGKAPQLVFKVRDHLARSPGICDAGTAEQNAEDRAAFDEWFLRQDPKALFLAFVPKLREVLGNHPLETPTPGANAPQPIPPKTTPTVLPSSAS